MSIDALMAELRKEYIDSLNDKVVEAHELLERRDFVSVQNLFHKLKGSGATYGIPEASQLGEIVEAYLKKMNVETVPETISDPKIQAHIKAGAEMLKRIRDARKSDHVYPLEKDPLYLLLLPEVDPAARVSTHGSE